MSTIIAFLMCSCSEFQTEGLLTSFLERCFVYPVKGSKITTTTTTTTTKTPRWYYIASENVLFSQGTSWPDIRHVCPRLSRPDSAEAVVCNRRTTTLDAASLARTINLVITRQTRFLTSIPDHQESFNQSSFNRDPLTELDKIGDTFTRDKFNKAWENMQGDTGRHSRKLGET